jgi:hypothetical protein
MHPESLGFGLVACWFLLFFRGLFFHPEDGGNIFLRNPRISPNFTVLQPRRPHSSNPNTHMLLGARASPLLTFGQLSDSSVIGTYIKRCWWYTSIKISIYPYIDKSIYVLLYIFLKLFKNEKENISYCPLLTNCQHTSESEPKWYLGFKVFTAVVMKSIVFRDMTPCSPLSWGCNSTDYTALYPRWWYSLKWYDF